MPNNWPKDTEAELDYQFNWANWLADGESIDSYSFEISPSGSLAVDSSSESGGVVTVWLTGGEDKTEYTVWCKIVTDNSTPRTDRRSATIKVSTR